MTGTICRIVCRVASLALFFFSDEDTGKQKWSEVIQFLEHCMASENLVEVEFVATLLE